MTAIETRCDFCSDPARWRYDAAEQLIMAMSDNQPKATMRSTGGWAACDMCRRLIDCNAREMLAVYSAARLPECAEMSFAAAQATCKAIQQAFWDAKRGPATRLEARSAP